MPQLSRLALAAVVVTVATSTLGPTPAAASSVTAPATAPSVVRSAGPSLAVGICRVWPKLCGKSPALSAVGRFTR